MNLYSLCTLDCCATGTSVFHMDGWFDSGIAGHLQKDVDIEARV